jgi:two-component system OmpR family response regulator
MRILVVEDNTMLANGIKKVLSDEGHAVDCIANGIEADDFLRTAGADLAIIDLRLPGMSGIDLLKSMRGRGDSTPVLVLTALGELTDKISGLDAGADDYVVKPVEMDEIKARIRALARRHTALTPNLERFGQLTYDHAARRLFAEAQEIELQRRELSLFEFLLKTKGRVNSKGAIFDALYGVGADVDENAIETQVSRLRRKLQGSGVTIKTVRGLGYMLISEEP